MVHKDLAIIQSTPWIQSHFPITDIDSSNWLSSYGTITLISKGLPIRSVFRTRYWSDMGRDGLYVDIRDKFTVIRLWNTHLESLVAHPRFRPGQVELASQYLHGRFMDAGMIAGDFNAIEEFDRTLYVEHGVERCIFGEWRGGRPRGRLYLGNAEWRIGTEIWVFENG
ncbi:hypothetical protein ABVK25_000160 [Lepraria finkii]|uniref:Endonuclease/exonuclease/phosphatase domain-containing protein n=1 Tax=Lepraria finkii TaxID=1340010 RepID=A0ABR4BRC9_9LECA